MEQLPPSLFPGGNCQYGETRLIFIHLPYNYHPQTLLLIPLVCVFFNQGLLGFSEYAIIYQKRKYFFNLFSLYLYQIFYFLSTAIPRTSTTMLNNNDDNEHLCLVFYFQGNGFSVSLLRNYFWIYSHYHSSNFFYSYFTQSGYQKGLKFYPMLSQHLLTCLFSFILLKQ